MSMRQYGARRVGRRIVKARTWPELFSCLVRDRTYLYGVKELSIEWNKQGAGNTAYRSFKYNYLVPLQYWNPDIKVEWKKVDSDEPCVRVVREDGQESKIVGASDQDLLRQIKEQFSTNPDPIKI